MVPSMMQKRGLYLLIGKRWHKRGGRCCGVGGGGAFLDGRALGLLLLLKILQVHFPRHDRDSVLLPASLSAEE